MVTEKISQSGDSWTLLRDSLGKVPDLKFEREQPEVENLPERERF